ncbi:MAG: transposase [Chloroflexi bacterium]|nr:transposase [Chloroflexota bacterium]
MGRNARLERLTELIDWAPLEALVADVHAAPVGRPSYPPVLMVKVLLLQQWYQAWDPAIEEALWERLSFRRFVGLGLQNAAPDHSTISRFRTQLARTGLAEALFAAVEQQLGARGVLVKQGTLVDATLVEARRATGARATQTRPEPGAAGRRASAARCTWAWTPSRSWCGARC